MARLEQSQLEELNSMSPGGDYRKLNPVLRCQLLNRLTSKPIPETAKLDRIRIDSEIAELKRRLARLDQETAGGFNARALRESVRAHVAGRITELEKQARTSAS